MSNPVNIFIAYSRSDAAFLDELRRHLMPLTRASRIKVWYDGEIEAGRNWEAEIKKSLAGAEIIVLMVSSDSIGSDYFYGNEVAAALERHENGTARVVPLIIRACQWTETPLKNLQALPKDGRPVANWQPRDDGWFSAVEGIGRLVGEIEGERRAAEKAVFEKENRETEAENNRIAAIAEKERREKKAVADAEKKRLADEAEKLRKKNDALSGKANPKNDLPKTAETSEWKINLGVGAIIVAIFAVCAFLFFKTEACISKKVKDLGKTEQPGIVLPANDSVINDSISRATRGHLVVDSIIRTTRGLRVIDSEKIGVKPATKNPKLMPLRREPAKKD